MPLVPSSTTESGWQFVAEPVVTKQAPIGGGKTALLRFTQDGRPVATTEAELALHMQSQAALPQTGTDKLKLAQLEAITREQGSDHELQAAIDQTPAAITRRATPVVISPPGTPMEQRAINLSRAAAVFGMSVQTEIEYAANATGQSFRSLKVTLLNAVGQVTAGPADIDSMELKLGADLREREMRDSRVQAMEDHKARQQAERDQAWRESDAGRIAALEARLGEQTQAANPDRYRPIFDGSGAVVGYLDSEVDR